MEGINPTAWVFFVGLALVILGLLIPRMGFFAKIGGFILLLYGVIWIVWIFIEANS